MTAHLKSPLFQCGVWWGWACGAVCGGVGVLSGENLSLEKERFSPDPPFPKKLTVIYTYFSAAPLPKKSLSVFSLKLLPLLAPTAYTHFLKGIFSFSAAPPPSHTLSVFSFKLLPLFSRFDTRLLSAFPLSAQIIYTGSENTWLVYMRMLKICLASV